MQLRCNHVGVQDLGPSACPRTTFQCATAGRMVPPSTAAATAQLSGSPSQPDQAPECHGCWQLTWHATGCPGLDSAPPTVSPPPTAEQLAAALPNLPPPQTQPAGMSLQWALCRSLLWQQTWQQSARMRSRQLTLQLAGSLRRRSCFMPAQLQPVPAAPASPPRTAPEALPEVPSGANAQMQSNAVNLRSGCGRTASTGCLTSTATPAPAPVACSAATGRSSILIQEVFRETELKACASYGRIDISYALPQDNLTCQKVALDVHNNYLPASVIIMHLSLLCPHHS